jgi:hypothetical protein
MNYLVAIVDFDFQNSVCNTVVIVFYGFVHFLLNNLQEFKFLKWNFCWLVGWLVGWSAGWSLP